MLRLPAVAGQFYPADPRELTRLVRKFSAEEPGVKKTRVRACLVSARRIHLFRRRSGSRIFTNFISDANPGVGSATFAGR